MTDDSISLREHLTSLIDAAERRADARFEAMKEMVDAAFNSSQKAIEKADFATEKRFEGVNEFREQLSDQASRFVTRETLDALIAKLETQIERTHEDLDVLAKRVDVREGQVQGNRITVGNLVTAVTLAVAVIGVLVVLSNYFSAP